jgi:hypothetical protein
MQIKIGWQNLNTTADGVRVYRSASAIDPANLPAVYATLAGNAATYTDTSVLIGVTYYYMFEVYKGTDRVFSPNVVATAAAYSGPGPQALIAGDLDMGFYGTVNASDFIDWTTFIAWANVSVPAKNPYANQMWLKFAYKGKTLFMPYQPVGTCAWSTLYAGGLVYGIDDVGPRTYNTMAATNQLRIITVQNSQFKVRLPTAVPPGFDLTSDFVNSNTGATNSPLNTNWYTADSYDTTLNLVGSEWNDLIMKLLSWTSASQRGENWAAYDAQLAYNSAPYIGMTENNIHQEMIPGLKTITRGYLPASSISYHPGKTNTAAYNANLYWRPVLELI